MVFSQFLIKNSLKTVFPLPSWRVCSKKEALFEKKEALFEKNEARFFYALFFYQEQQLFLLLIKENQKKVVPLQPNLATVC